MLSATVDKIYATNGKWLISPSHIVFSLIASVCETFLKFKCDTFVSRFEMMKGREFIGAKIVLHVPVHDDTLHIN